MPPAAAVVGGAIITGVLGSRAAGKAARASQAGAEAGIAEQRRQFDITQEQITPFREAGAAALEQQRILLGLGSGLPADPNQARREELQGLISQAQQQPAQQQQQQPAQGSQFQPSFARSNDISDFETGQRFLARNAERAGPGPGADNSRLSGLQSELDALPAQVQALSNQEQQQQAFDQFNLSPGQKFLRDRAQKNLVRNAAAIGGLGGGNVRTSLVEQGVGFAQQDFQNRFARLGQIAGQGQAAAVNIGQFGAQTAGNVANLQQSGAQSRASGILGQNQALQQGIGGAFTGAAQGGLFGGGNQFTNRFGGAGQNPVGAPLATPFGGR